MTYKYTNEEKGDILVVHFKSNRNSEHTCTRFSEKQQLQDNFGLLANNLVNFGSFEC